GCLPFHGGQAVDAAFDLEDRVDPGHRLQRDRRDVVAGFALADIPLDVGEFEELPAGMAPAESAADRAGLTVAAVKVVVTAVGIGLEDSLPPCEMPVRVGHLPSA